MLKNLIKYEFKGTARIFLLTYVVVVVLAGVNAAMLSLKPPSNPSLDLVYNGASTIMGLLYGIAAFAAFLLTFVIIIVRFYRMLGDEGYLWFTLPVTPAQQIFGKLIPAIVWTIVTTIVTLASVGLVLLGSHWPSQLATTWRGLVAQGYNPGVWLVCGILFILISLLVNVMMFYAAMVWGPNLIKNNRLGGSVVAYIIFYIALEVVNLVVFLLMLPLLTKALDGIQTYHGTMPPPPPTGQEIASLNQLGAVFGGLFGFEYLVLAVVCFIITRYFLTKKLNLA
ncbi:MAG: hypothetical protein FWD80_06255 [Propionibacteriaceae bacterium]|nr:hypothetical protein [Propionibacteriaceae bacterium]